MTDAANTAEIIAIGSELVTPDRIDTNSLFLTARLNDLGVVVQAKAVVGDDVMHVAAIVKSALVRARIVIVTGGLGPTADDITRQAIAEALGRPLVEDPAILEAILERFRRRGVPMPAINRRQAQVVDGATVLVNPHGTAPGQLVIVDDRVIVLLPGPPRELQPMFETSVAPVIRERVGADRRLRRRVLKVTGRSESQVEELAEPVYSALGAAGVHVDTTILASPGQIDLHLIATGTDAAAIDRVLDNGVSRLRMALGPVVFSDDGRALERVVGDLLLERGWYVAAAESCTAGLILGRLTEVPGSSAWVLGGVVAYANDVKVQELGVSAETIGVHGAVSEPVALAMARGVKERLNADIAVAATGIAGPTGGTSAKPVGTVVIAVAGPAMHVRTFQFPGDRETIRRHSTAAALEMLRRVMLGLPVGT